jgi:hypothetical protein
MKTKILILSSLIIGGLLFNACQKDNALIEETSFEQIAASQDEADSPKTGPWGGSLDQPGNWDDDQITNFPDPFTNYTTIQYHMKKASWVRLSVYANQFEAVVLLVDEYQKAGVHQAKFNASGLPYGEYIAELKVGNAIYKEVMTKRPPIQKKDNSPVSER